MSKDQILALLPSLSHDDIEAVIAVASQLLGGLGNEPDEVAALIIDAISAALNRPTGLPNGANLPQPLQKTFKKKFPELILFFDQNFKGWNEYKIIRIAFTRKMMGMLRDNLTELHIKPSYTNMIRHLHRMPEVFDISFPHYLGSGLGPLFLMRLR